MTTKTKRTAASNTTEGAMPAGHEAVETFVKAGAQNYEKMFSQAQDRMQEAMKQYDDVAALGQATMKALVASGTAYAKGVEQLSAEMLAFSKQSAEESAAAARSAMSAKTLQELIDLQTSYAKTSVDAFMAQGTRFSEIATKMTQESVEPLNERFNAMANTFAHKAV